MSKVEKHSSKLIQRLLSKSNPAEKKKVRIKMIIAANIDDAIQKKGWSRSKLAKELNVSRSLVTKWLSGTHNFTMDTLLEISNLLDVELNSLFTEPTKSMSYHDQEYFH